MDLYFHQRCMRVPFFFTSSLTLVIVFQIITVLSDVNQYLIVFGFALISLIISDVDTFSRTFWPYVYLLMYSDLLSVFKIRLFGFQVLSFMSFLYILDINPYQIYDLNFFLHFRGCFFILLMVSFPMQKLFSMAYLLQSNLFIFTFYLCFYQDFYAFVLFYAFKSLIHFEFIFVYGVRQSSRFIFLHGLSSFIGKTNCTVALISHVVK